MVKRIIAILLSVLTLTMGLTGCGSSENEIEIDEDVLSVNSFLPTEKYVKKLGRTEQVDEGLWLAYSGSGAEFTFNGTKATVTILGDDTINSEDWNSVPRIAIYVNDELVVDEMLMEESTSFTVFESEEAEDCVIRIIKLSETGNSTCVIGSIEVEAFGAIKPTEDKEYTIEFVGDSITCGYGVDAEDQNSSFSTRTENASKSYAYLTAQLLDADYSLVSKSGHGIISGYTSDGTIQSWGVMSQFYECFGSGSGTVNGVTPDSVEWDFKNNPVDLVVINLGTNDYSYTGSDADKQNEYKTEYVEFIKQIRENNPDAYIICALGIMGNELYPMVEEAVSEYVNETGDEKVTSFEFDVQSSSDGYGADWHPSAVTQEKSAEALAEFIREWLGW
ncbi:MAG: GDSL-type esterase/lipase family protein [Oscillospiraceae bacterium]|nr:GDSL-type esterase/lipase family protein [Oscillospiraceae bacterium]